MREFLSEVLGGIRSACAVIFPMLQRAGLGTIAKAVALAVIALLTLIRAVLKASKPEQPPGPELVAGG